MVLDSLKRVVSQYWMPGATLGISQTSSAMATNPKETLAEVVSKTGDALANQVASTDTSGLVLVNGEFYFHGANLIHLISVVGSIISLVMLVVKFIDERRKTKREYDSMQLALDDAQLLREFEDKYRVKKEKK